MNGVYRRGYLSTCVGTQYHIRAPEVVANATSLQSAQDRCHSLGIHGVKYPRVYPEAFETYYIIPHMVLLSR